MDQSLNDRALSLPPVENKSQVSFPQNMILGPKDRIIYNPRSKNPYRIIQAQAQEIVKASEPRVRAKYNHEKNIPANSSLIEIKY